MRPTSRLGRTRVARTVIARPDVIPAACDAIIHVASRVFRCISVDTPTSATRRSAGGCIA